MALVEKKWNNGTVEVSQFWLDRAKELVREHGVGHPVAPLKALEEEMGLPRESKTVSTILVIAEREVGEELRNEKSSRQERVALIKQGWMDAAKALREASDRAYAKDNRTEWAVLVSGADFLDKQIELAEQFE